MKGKLINLYKEVSVESADQIIEILHEVIGKDSNVENEVRTILNEYCSHITSKWSKNQKYLRTLFALEAFGDQYPEEMLRTSLSIDTTINLLDDLLDEELGKVEKIPLMEELIRIFSVYNYQRFDHELKEQIGAYFNKIVAVLLSEKIFMGIINKEENDEAIVELATKMYYGRSMDIDIFVDIPLYALKDERSDKILKMARSFRVVNLLEKDIRDIEHDKKNAVETFPTFVFDKDKKELLGNLVDKCYVKTTELREENPIIENFYSMFERDAKKVWNLI